LREEEGIGADMWVQAISEMREGEGYRFGIVSCWAVGFFWSQAESCPRSLLLLFLFLFSFSFSVFFILS
jgi:hypothetical protein